MDKQIYIDPFGYVEPNRNEVAIEANTKDVAILGFQINEETHATETVITGYSDIDAEIQTFKDDCGLALVQKQLARGADPAQFADDGNHSADVSAMTDVNTAFRKSKEYEEKLLEFARKLGVSLDDLKDDNKLASIIEAKIKSQVNVKAQDNVKAQVNVNNEVSNNECK